MTCTPSSSTHNQFSVLHVDSIPEIKEPVESPPVVPPKTDPPAPSRKRKPNWEKRIPDHLVIDTLNEKEGRCRSLTLKIELQTTDTAETKSITALLDSGATGMFIDREYVKEGGFTTRALSNPIPVRNVDGTPNEAGSIMDVVELNLWYRNHAERVFFAVTSLGKQNVIMGHTWLRKHNPDINWVTGDVKMSRCSRRCCSGCRDEIREKRREQNSRPVVSWTAPKERFLTSTEMRRMMRTWTWKLKMVTEYSPPVYINLQKRSTLPPPSLNVWWKPSNGTKTLLTLKKAPPLIGLVSAYARILQFQPIIFAY